MLPNKEIPADKICVSSDFGELTHIREFVIHKAIEFGFNEEEAFRISLAVDEACSNLIRHAFKMDASQMICVIIQSDSNEFIVDIQDMGFPFNPLDVAPPEMMEYFKQFKKGGLGIHIMRSVMDEISYQPSQDKAAPNTLRLKKYRSAS